MWCLVLIFFCSFAVLDDFPTVLQFLIDPNILPPPPFVDSGDLITLSFSQCSEYMMYTRLYANTFTGHALLTIHSLHRKEKLRIITFVSPCRQYCVSSSTKQRRKIAT